MRQSDADPGDHARINDFRQFCLQTIGQCAVVFPNPFENPHVPTSAFRIALLTLSVRIIAKLRLATSVRILIGQFLNGQIVRQAESANYA